MAGRSRWIRVRHRLELAGVRFLMALPRLFPLRMAVKMGGVPGLAAFDLFRVRRDVSLGNLEAAFGDRITAGERKAIARRSYVNFAKSMVEFASLGRIRREEYGAIVRISGLKHLSDPLAAGKGVIAVTGHFGSWELLGAGIAARGLPIDFLVGEQSNSRVNDLMNDLRREAGIGIIERGVAARGVFDALKKGRVVALLADQDARKAGIFVDFFGTPVSAFQGPAQFAVRTGCPIVCCCIVRRGDETHDVTFFPPIYARDGAERVSEVRRLTEAHTRVLEGYIAANPDHYFWPHRRWKTRPPA